MLQQSNQVHTGQDTQDQIKVKATPRHYRL